MEKKYSFFQHRECEYFPCHPTEWPEDFNCLFCYCPLYALGETCGGDFHYVKGIKDCSDCIRPHLRENYDEIQNRFEELAAIAAEKAPS